MSKFVPYDCIKQAHTAPPAEEINTEVVYTPQEKVILNLLVSIPNDDKSVANLLGRSVGTIGTHIKNIMQKANVSSRSLVLLNLLESTDAYIEISNQIKCVMAKQYAMTVETDTRILLQKRVLDLLFMKSRFFENYEGLRYKPQESDGFGGRLTNREIEIMIYIVKGYSNKEVATMLGVTEYTLGVHRRNLYSKLGVSNANECIKLVFPYVHAMSELYAEGCSTVL